MIVSSTQNVNLWEKLFGNSSDYEKWGPKFISDFVKKHLNKGIVPGVMSNSTVSIDDSLVDDFLSWIESEGIEI